MENPSLAIDPRSTRDDLQKAEVGRATVSALNLEAEVIFAFAHPSISYLDSFLTESLVWHGAGVIGIDGRYVKEGDSDLSFALAAEDVAVALSAVVPPDRQLVLVGHSGGGALMALVQVKFRLGSAMVFLAPHPSRANIFESWIDPALLEDGTRDPELDIYADGRRPPFTEAFVQKYRAAQRARVVGIAEQAARHLLAHEPEAKLSIPGLFADPRFVDRTLDPNQRAERPLEELIGFNQRPGYLADGCTARSFFDQWYRPTTQGDLVTLAPWLDVPTLSVAFGADPVVFPSQTLVVATALPRGSTVWTLENAVHNPADQKDHLDALVWKILAWIPY